MTQSIAPPTRKDGHSAKRRPRSARTPRRAAISSIAASLSSRVNSFFASSTIMNPLTSSVRSRLKLVWILKVHPAFASPRSLEKCEHLVARTIDCARAERDKHVALAQLVAQGFRRAFERSDVLRVLVAVTLDRFCQNFSSDARYRVFARCVNVCDKEHVRVIERARELFH